MIEFGPVLAPATDLLRLLAIPVFAWAAWRDIKIRRVPNVTWLPLVVLGVVLLAWDGWRAFNTGGIEWQLFLIAATISLGLVVPLSYAFWRMGGFGGADAKALMTLALLFPTFPSYYVGTAVYPSVQTDIGVFSFTILTNAVLVAVTFPIALVAFNAAQGQFASVMAFGRIRHWSDLATAHGRLMEDPAGQTRDGLDLDALRMYLRWRGLTLEELRQEPERYRDPETLPDEPNPPTDGAVPANGILFTDGGVASSVDSDGEPPTTADEVNPAAVSGDRYDDPWGAAAFLEDIPTSAYGTTPEKLRGGLDVLCEKEKVWVSPGVPFIVPIFVGLLVALGYGDLLFALLSVIGLV